LIALVNNIEVGIFLCDRAGKVLTVNHQACNLLGRQEHQLNGKDVRQLIQLDTQLMQPSALGSTGFTDTVSLDEGSYGIPIMVSTRPLVIEDQPCNLITAVNIERRKQAEQELVSLNESLEELVAERTQELADAQEALVRRNKVMALGNLSAVVVHELSQPLSAMNSLVATIQSKLSLGNVEGVAETAKRIEPISRKMDGIIKMLKNYSYFDSAELSICELRKLIDDSIELLRETIDEHKIQLELEYPQQSVFVKVNQLKFDLLLSNIIRNAIDAVSHREAPKIMLRVFIAHDKVSVVVSDNGDGIDETIIEHLFDAFQTTKQIGKGMGLGLSVANEIATEFGGHIEAKNLNSGGEFSITLPIADCVGAEQVERTA
jgi:PAS domain S-box-containing protein